MCVICCNETLNEALSAPLFMVVRHAKGKVKHIMPLYQHYLSH